MKNNKNVLISLGIFLFFINFILAVPPVTTVSSFPTGYNLLESYHDYHKINTDFVYYFFVQNSSDGGFINDTFASCDYFLADEEYNIIYSGNPSYNTSGFWYLDIEKGNFSEYGTYSYGLYCSDGVGGSLSGSIIVNSKGKDMDYALPIFLFLYIILIGGMFLFNYGKKEKVKISGDWDLFKMFGESVKEFKFFINWMLIVLIFCLSTHFFYVYEFELLNTIFTSIFYLSMLVLIPVVIIFFLKFLDVRKRCNELANLSSWGRE